MVHFTKAIAFVALSAVASALPLSRQGCVAKMAACVETDTCCDGTVCTPTPWEAAGGYQCLDAPPQCYEAGERNVGASGDEYVPYAPCCDGEESLAVPGEYGRFCPPAGDMEDDLMDASGEPEETDEPLEASAEAEETDEPLGEGDDLAEGDDPAEDDGLAEDDDLAGEDDLAEEEALAEEEEDLAEDIAGDEAAVEIES